MWQVINKNTLQVVFTGNSKRDAQVCCEENGYDNREYKIAKRRVATNGRTAKAKGSKYERDVAALYVEFGIDPKAGRMPLSGADKFLKGDIRKAHNTALEFRFIDEVKRQENLAIPLWWKQAVSQCTIGEEPLLHFKQNSGEALSVIRTRTLFSLMGRIVELTKENMDLKVDGKTYQVTEYKPTFNPFRDVMYQLGYAKEAIKKAEKALEKEGLT